MGVILDMHSGRPAFKFLPQSGHPTTDWRGLPQFLTKRRSNELNWPKVASSEPHQFAAHHSCPKFAATQHEQLSAVLRKQQNVTHYISKTIQRRIYRTAQEGLDQLSQDCSKMRNCTSITDQQTNRQIACFGHRHSSENPKITHRWELFILRRWYISDCIRYVSPFHRPLRPLERVEV